MIGNLAKKGNPSGTVTCNHSFEHTELLSGRIQITGLGDYRPKIILIDLYFFSKEFKNKQMQEMVETTIKYLLLDVHTNISKYNVSRCISSISFLNEILHKKAAP